MEVTENELLIMTGVMILKSFPEETKEIIKSLRLIKQSICSNTANFDKVLTDKEMVEHISQAIGFLAVHAKIDGIENV